MTYHQWCNEPNDSMPQPSISVVVVSDHESSGAKSWKHEKAMLAALGKQDIGESFDVLLILNAETGKSMPPSLAESFPGLTIVQSPERRSERLKNEGVRQSRTPLVAIVETDSLPRTDWLRRLADNLRERDEAAVASGCTVYGRESMYKRVLTLLDRGFDDLGRSGPTRFISNNGALYRREVLEQFPYPDAPTPFLSSRNRNREIEKAGHRFVLERAAIMQHAIGGWEFMRDHRRNGGYADLAATADHSYATIARRLGARLRDELADFRRVGPDYLKWYDWPLAVLLLIGVRFLELPGMIDALRKRDTIPRSHYC